MKTIEKFLQIHKDDSSKSLEYSDYKDPKRYLTGGSKIVVVNRLSSSTSITPAKLTRIMKQRQPYVMKSRDELIQENIDELFEEKRKSMLASRLRHLPMRPGNQFAATGDEYCLMKEIELGHGVNSRDSYNGRAVIHEAAAAGHFHIVRFLCNNYKDQLDIDLPSKLGNSTALHLAVEKGYRQIASLLITNGANINAKDRLGNTPLHLVNSLPLVKLLFRFPVNAVARNNQKRTPLENYLYNVPVEEHVREIIEWMRMREENQFLEIAKLKEQKEERIAERELRRAELVISEGSTVIHSEESSPMTSPREEDKPSRKKGGRKRITDK
jgi:hypothetical protein